MKLIHRKNILSLIVALVASVTLSIGSGADYLGTLSYWEDDGAYFTDCIGYWQTTPIIKVKYANSGFTNFSSSFSTGVSSWSAAGMSLSYVPENSSYSETISVYAGNANEIYNKTGFVYGDDYLGYTGPAPSSRSEYGTYTYNSTDKLCISLTHEIVTIRYCTSLTNSTNKCKHVCTHELGHAFGWMNHTNNPSTNDVMRAYANENYTLSNRDKRHVLQQYN